MHMICGRCFCCNLLRVSELKSEMAVGSQSSRLLAQLTAEHEAELFAPYTSLPADELDDTESQNLDGFSDSSAEAETDYFEDYEPEVSKGSHGGRVSARLAAKRDNTKVGGQQSGCDLGGQGRGASHSCVAVQDACAVKMGKEGLRAMGTIESPQASTDRTAVLAAAESVLPEEMFTRLRNLLQDKKPRRVSGVVSQGVGRPSDTKCRSKWAQLASQYLRQLNICCLSAFGLQARKRKEERETF